MYSSILASIAVCACANSCMNSFYHEQKLQCNSKCANMPFKSRDICIFWCLQARNNYLRICKKCNVLHVMMMVSFTKFNGKRA